MLVERASKLEERGANRLRRQMFQKKPMQNSRKPMSKPAVALTP